MGDLKSELEAIFPQPPKCPRNHKYGNIADLYEHYQENLEDTFVEDQCGHKNWFRAENFPHLVKLEFFNRKINSWVEAAAGPAIEQMKDKSFNEDRYRILDGSRSRTLFWVPDVIRLAENIHPNARSKSSDIYSRRYSRDSGKDIKIVLVETRSSGERVIKTSFWVDDVYHKGCIGHPARFPFPKIEKATS
jgi:hypothetical protein